MAIPLTPVSIPTAVPAAPTDSVDFDQFTVGDALNAELEAATPPRSDDVESLLQRYHAEQHNVNRRNMTRRLKGSPDWVSANPGASPTHSPSDPSASTGHGFGASATTGHGQLPALLSGSAGGAEVERLRIENRDLQQTVNELRHVLEANDPQVWEQLHKETEQLLTQREQELSALRDQCAVWEQKMSTHRLVPADDDLAQMADELEQERCQTAQERRQIDDQKRQLKDDEEVLMKQMREMEVSMARDRADLARQRVELQRLQDEVRHELELLQRGDSSVKERLAQFQRRIPDSAPSPAKSKDSQVFKRLFGQS